MRAFNLKVIFSEFEEKITQPDYHPTNPVDLLKARLTAAWMLQQGDKYLAEAFLEKTAAFEYDLSFFKPIESRDQFSICSIYSNTKGDFLEYKITFDNSRKTEHFHLQYAIKDQKCFYLSQSAPLIRVIGDPVLQRPATLFPQNPTPVQQEELASQIAHLKELLIATAGAGIAANQCADIENPFSLIISGLFYDSPAHVKGVAERYPQSQFPAATIMVNPQIISVSETLQRFNHACLSVPCANRCEVESPLEISVSYQDPMENGVVKKATFKGVDAVVLWHELSHLDGKTYIDHTFEALPLADLNQCKLMILEELEKRRAKDYNHIPQLSVKPFHVSVKINEAGVARLDQQEFAKVLPNMTEETLNGLCSLANQLLKKKGMAMSLFVFSQYKAGFLNSTMVSNRHQDEELASVCQAKL